MPLKKACLAALLAASVIGAGVGAASAGEANMPESSLIKVEKLKLESQWDKVFSQSEKVLHEKVLFVNRYGITLAADLYLPKNADGKLAAVAVSGPF